MLWSGVEAMVHSREFPDCPTGLPAEMRAVRSLRRGYTLVEMLVTIFIVMLITAATIPLVLPAVEGRRAREAARAVSVMLGSARSRAMELGRPCGVMLERFAGQPQFCTTLTPCEVPEPYAGDTLASMVSLAEVHTTGAVRNTWIAVVPNYGTDLGWVDPSMVNSTILGDALVRPGDLIQFNNTGPRYRLEIDWTSLATPFWYVAYNVDGDGDGVLDGWNANGLRVTQVAVPSGAVKYRVFRQPVKSASASVVLPESMVIDLMCSGLHGTIDLLNREDHDTFYPLFWEAGNVNNGMRYTAPAVDPLFFDTTTSEEQKPVTIMFGPSGSLEQVYHYGDLVAPVRTVGETHDAPVYLLVARREQVPVQSALTRADWPVNMRMESWRDAENLWVVVEPRNGRVAAFPCMVVPNSHPRTGWLPLTGAAPFSTVQRLYSGINASRTTARTSVHGLGAQ